MNADKAKELGYSLELASPFEVGLIKNGQGVRTWFASAFNGEFPTLDHPVILDTIEINEGIDRNEWPDEID